MNTDHPRISELGDAALAYAAIGWHVFPLTPGGKTPLYANPHQRGTPERSACRGYAHCGRFGHGVLDATCDRDVVWGWWTRTPSANVGLATGIPSVDVVDVDVKDGSPGMASFERLRRAGLLRGSIAVVETPSGGLHGYFEPTTQPNASLRGYGLDFRGRGGYVVVPPSAIAARDGRRYVWLEPLRLDVGASVTWRVLREYLVPPPLRPVEPARQLLPTPAHHLVDWLAGQGEGNRNDALWWAVCKALEGGHDRAVIRELESTAASIGLSDHEIEKTVRSATRHVLAEARS